MTNWFARPVLHVAKAIALARSNSSVGRVLAQGLEFHVFR
jgi:hypothetical protein